MAYLQSDIDNIVNGIVNRFTGQRIAFPNGNYPGECTAPIVWYLTNMGAPIPYMYGDRADGWGVQFPVELAPYFRHEAFQPGKAYPRGTILMWNSPHIAIVLADSGGDNGVLCFEQNADPDGAPCGIHNRTLNTSTRTCTYAIIPIIEEPISTPPIPLYSVIETYPQGKQVRLKLQPTNKYGMNYNSLDYMAAHPVEVHDAGEIVTVSNKVHHNIVNYDYYREADQIDGYNVLDCDDYTPPLPTPTPYVPPAAPLAVKLAPKVTIVASVPYFSTSNNAKSSYKAQGTIKAGEYYQIAVENGMWNISSDNMKDLQHWINPGDNVVPPEPVVITPTVNLPKTYKPSEVPIGTDSDTSWKASYVSFYPDRRAVPYKTLNVIQMKEYGGRRETVDIDENKQINIIGTFKKNGVTFYRPRANNDANFEWFFGIPMVDDNGKANLAKLVADMPEKLTIGVLFNLWRDDAKKYLQGRKIWDIFK